MNKGIVTLIGFIIFLIGFLSILFSIVGLRYTFLKFISDLGGGTSLVIYLIMLFGGIITMYISRMPKEEDDINI